MKEFVLSLLSRGYGQIVPDENGHDGRLEVCFEPEDYFNWKSQPPWLRLTSSGHFLGHVDPAPPKTYSTRRGPLILYSEDLALSYQPGTVNRKRKAPSGSKHEVEYHLHTLQDLTGAILAYGKKQSKAGFLAGVTHPLIPDTKHANKLSHMHGKTEEKHNQSKEKDGQVRYQPHFLCSPRPNRAALGPLPPITKGLVHTESLEKTDLAPAEKCGQVKYQAHSLYSPRINKANLDPLPPITEGLVQIDSQEKSQAPDEQITFKTKSQKKPKVKIRQSLKTEADTCRAHMSPIPETEVAQANQMENQTILPHLTDHPKDPNGHEKHKLMKNMSGVGEMCTLRSVNVDSSLDSCPLSRLNYYGGHMEGFRQIRHCGGETKVRRVTTETDPSLTMSYLPPINPPVNSDLSTLTMTKPKIDDMGSCEESPEQELKVNFPDITPSTTYVNHPERSVHRKVLLLLPPQKEHLEPPALHDELHETLIEDKKSCGEMELTEELPERRQDPLSDSTCRIIEMDLGHVAWSSALEKRDQHPPIGPLPPLVGRRGPGKQSSMAVYSQNLHDTADTTEPQTGNIRGCLPPELRERQAGEAVGTLIMGPDGEIIRLSLWDPVVDTEDHPIMGDVTQGHVLKVVTSEEDLKQPWTILIQDHIRNKGDITTHNTEATTSNKEQLDSTHHEVFMVNKPAERIKVKRVKKNVGSYNEIVKTQTNTQEEEQDEEEQEEDEEEAQEEDEEEAQEEDEEEAQEEDEEEAQEEDEEEAQEEDEEAAQEEDEEEEEYLGSDNEVCDKAQVFLAYAHAEDNENNFSSDNAVNQETQMFKISSRARQTKAKRKKHLGSDIEIIPKEQRFRVNPKTKKTNAKRNDDDLGADNERIQEGQNDSQVKHQRGKRKVYLSSGNEIKQNKEVYLPEETLEEQSHSITHRPSRRGEGTTAVQRKTTTLKPETGVTAGSRKSKGAAPAISPKSTQFTPTTDKPGESLSTHGQAEIQTGLPVRAAKGHSKNAGGTEDAENKPLENVKKNKKINKQTGKPKKKTVQIDKDDETQNSSTFNDTTATSKPKKNKNKEITEEEKVELTESQDPKVKTKKKKKGQPAFVVGKPRPQEAERIANQVDKPERETYETYERKVSPYNTEDDELDNSVSQEHNYTETGDDTDADTDSVCTEMQEAQDSPRSVYSSHRSQYSQFTAQSHPSTHGLSQSRTTSVGTLVQRGPCSPATLSLIHLPPQSAQHPTSDPLKSESSNKVKINEEPNLKNQTDTKAAALAEKAERRRLEVERKRREKEEEKKREQEKEATEERMRMELEEEQNRRAEETRLRKIREEEERRRRQEEETDRQRREQAEKERERRRQEEKRRLLERLQRERQEEEKRQAAERERQRLEEEAWREEERIKVSQMQEAERLEYLCRRQEEEEERRKAAEERRRKDEEAARRAEEEARLQAELFARQRAALEEQLKFHRGLFVEAEGLEQTQDISRPWVFSYFTLLKLLGLAESS